MQKLNGDFNDGRCWNPPSGIAIDSDNALFYINGGRCYLTSGQGRSWLEPSRDYTHVLSSSMAQNRPWVLQLTAAM